MEGTTQRLCLVNIDLRTDRKVSSKHPCTVIFGQCDVSLVRIEDAQEAAVTPEEVNFL
jgi:hypothetical protein